MTKFKLLKLAKLTKNKRIWKVHFISEETDEEPLTSK